MFFYESVFNSALAGINGSSLISTVMNVSYSILLVCFLFGVYQSFARGGDVRLLGVTCLKYLSMGLALVAYPSAFSSVNGMFNALAAFIDSTSAVRDPIGNWLGQLSAYWTNNGFQISWSLLTTTLASFLNMILMVVGYILYPVTYTLFAFFYAMYGSILYVVGPLVLALYPVIGIGQMARTYLINLMIFNGWGVIYAIFGVLIGVINMNSVNTLAADQSFLGQFFGLGANLLIGLVSVFYSLGIALIPYVASRIVKGDVGATMLTMVASVFTAAKTVPAAVSGAAGGYNTSMNGLSSSNANASKLPNQASAGRYPGFNVAHGVGHAMGRTVGMIARQFK